MMIARKKYLLFKRAVISLQGRFRMKMARRELCSLRIEAKSVNRLREVKYSLENKVLELQSRLDERKVQMRQKESIIETYSKKMETLEEVILELKYSLSQSAEREKSLGEKIEQLEDTVKKNSVEKEKMLEKFKALEADNENRLKAISSLENLNKIAKDPSSAINSPSLVHPTKTAQGGTPGSMDPRGWEGCRE